jgi:hypothetical protein
MNWKDRKSDVNSMDIACQAGGVDIALGLHASVISPQARFVWTTGQVSPLSRL